MLLQESKAEGASSPSETSNPPTELEERGYECGCWAGEKQPLYHIHPPVLHQTIYGAVQEQRRRLGGKGCLMDRGVSSDTELLVPRGLDRQLSMNIGAHVMDKH